MNKFYFLTVLLPVILIISCNEQDIVNEKICTEYSTAKVDSIYAPDTVSVNDTLKILLKGKLGPDGCYLFERFESQLNNNVLDITVWGKHLACQPCIQVGMGFNEIFYVNNHQIGEFYIYVHQPFGTVIIDSVFVW